MAGGNGYRPARPRAPSESEQRRVKQLNRELAWAQLCDKLEERVRSAKAEVINAREKERRRTRGKSRGQKIRMIESKKHRAKHKASRGRVGSDW